MMHSLPPLPCRRPSRDCTRSIALLFFSATQIVLTTPPDLLGQLAQNPSPMVENTRAHERVPRQEVRGQRIPLTVGHLFIPEPLRDSREFPLFVHFHGATWLPEVAASQDGRFACLAIHIGSGSGVYSRQFKTSGTFAGLLAEAAQKSQKQFTTIGLTAWSAGYGAVREILRTDEDSAPVEFVLLMDGLHSGYTPPRDDAAKRRPQAEDLELFERLARRAVEGDTHFVITHSEVFPGTFASTTETADFLLDQLELQRTAVLEWGPVGMQQLSEVRAGKFVVLGYAGNSAPDHVDHFHALPEWLRSFAP